MCAKSSIVYSYFHQQASLQFPLTLCGWSSRAHRVIGFHDIPCRLRRLEGKKAQQTSSQTAQNAVKNLLDREEETVNNLVKGEDELAQGKDKGRKVDQDTSLGSVS